MKSQKSKIFDGPKKSKISGNSENPVFRVFRKKPRFFLTKAQAAMEFLMTYGWAVLIVIVAIAAMVYFGSVGKAFFFPERCIISTGTGLYCEDFVAYPGAIILRIRNALPEQVEITNASASQNGYSCNLTTTVTIPARSSTNLALAGGPTCFDLTQSGKKLKAELSVTFKKKYLPRTSGGDLQVKVIEGTAYICKNAQENGLCSGLDLIFGEGYRQECCDRYNLCC